LTSPISSFPWRPSPDCNPLTFSLFPPDLLSVRSLQYNCLWIASASRTIGVTLTKDSRFSRALSDNICLSGFATAVRRWTCPCVVIPGASLYVRYKSYPGGSWMTLNSELFGPGCHWYMCRPPLP
jgi:hypothetical protein